MKSSYTLTNRRLYVYKLCTILLSLLGAIFGAVAFANADDTFASNSFLIYNKYPSTHFIIFIILSAVGTISAPFLFRNAKPTTRATLPTAISSKFPAIAMIGIAAWEIINLFNGAKSILGIAAIVCPVVSAVFYATFRHGRLSKASIPSAYGCLALCIILTIRMYTDMSLEINAPLKLLTQFSAILMIFSIITDIRSHTGECSLGQYVCSKMLFVTTSITCGACGLIALIAQRGIYPPDYIVYPLLFLFCGMDALTSLLTCAPQSDD